MTENIKCRSSEQLDDFMFHTIIGDGWTAYISEYDDEVIGGLFFGDELNNPCIEAIDFDEAFKEIMKRVVAFTMSEISKQQQKEKLIELMNDDSSLGLYDMPSDDKEVQECDATMPNSSNADDKQK